MARSRVLISGVFFKEHAVRTNTFKTRGKKRAGLGGEAFLASLSPFACLLDGTHQYLPALRGKPTHEKVYQR